MASSNSVTLFSSVILGIAVYGETLSKTGTAHAGSTVIGLVVAVVGIALLAGSERPTRRRRAPPTRRRRRDGHGVVSAAGTPRTLGPRP